MLVTFHGDYSSLEAIQNGKIKFGTLVDYTKDELRRRDAKRVPLSSNQARMTDLEGETRTKLDWPGLQPRSIAGRGVYAAGNRFHECSGPAFQYIEFFNDYVRCLSIGKYEAVRAQKLKRENDDLTHFATYHLGDLERGIAMAARYCKINLFGRRRKDFLIGGKLEYAEEENPIQLTKGLDPYFIKPTSTEDWKRRIFRKPLMFAGEQEYRLVLLTMSPGRLDDDAPPLFLQHSSLKDALRECGEI